MNIKTISLVLGLSITGNLAAAERMCFGQVPVETSTDLVAKITIAENDWFTTNKCKRYFSYYEKHVNFTSAECEANKEQLSLDKGYAPFGAFFRGTDSTGKDNIASYDWEIKNIATNEILTTYNAFNASYVFDEPGEYSATLTITAKNGSTSTDTKNITVWARDGKDYFVDSVIGDDRYNGLAQAPDNTCDVNTAVLNSCTGPWKTATRALGEMAPYKVTNYPNGEYTADNICTGTETADIVRYKQGNFKIFRSSTFVESEALKDNDGNFLPAISTQLCSTKVAKRNTILRPGDQVLFNRGQQFKLETAINEIRKYTATHSDGITYNYELLQTNAIARTGHWSKAQGIHFGTYGTGDSPLIKNTGKRSASAMHLQGQGMFGFSMTNLEFNLNSSTPKSLDNRATFMILNGNPINTVLKHINVKEMNQGITASVRKKEPQGLFISNSSFYDSTLTQLFISNSYTDVAIINNIYDYSYNHLIYSNISHGLVHNNTLSRPAFGRTAYRINGGDFENPNNYVWISDNTMSGWIDPRTRVEFGQAFAKEAGRYNFELVNIAPNNGSFKPIAFHDIVFTRNKLSDAETFMTVGAGENIRITYNTFQSPNSTAEPFIKLGPLAHRPFRNVSINHNKFIDSASIQEAWHGVTSFINWKNYSNTKCTDQFTHKKLNINNNSFYTLNNRRRILTFADIKQGKDLSGVDLPDLTLDQAEAFLNKELTLSNNQLTSVNNDIPTLQIGGTRSSDGDNKVSSDTIDWSQYFQSSDSKYRLYNSLSQFTQQTTGGLSLASTDSLSIEALLSSNGAGAISEPVPALTWNDIIAYAEENNISPADLETMILNQVLASNPTYSMPGVNYSSDVGTFDRIGNWFTSIPSSVASLFESEEDQWNDAKQLATSNKVSSAAVMVSMKK